MSLLWCLRVNDKYIFKSSDYSNLFDVNETMTGNNGYRLPVNDKEKTEEVKIPT